MDFAEKRLEQVREQYGIGRSAGDILRDDPKPINDKKLVISGPKELDCNVRKWHLGDSIGVIGSSGIGKTSFLLWNFRELLKNNPEGIIVFVACEMTQNQILSKWQKATVNCPEISDRLYIVTAFDDNNNARDLSIVGIKNLINIHEKILNKKVISYVIDHLHIIKRADNESLDDVIKEFKMMNIEMQTIGFLTSQTTKGKSGSGDLPLDKTACYGTSAFEWEMTQIYTLCQPLKRVEDDVDLKVTSFKLAKNRFKEAADEVKEGVNYLLKFDNDTESYSALSQSDKVIFSEWYAKVIEIRKLEEKDGEYIFDTSHDIITPSGKTVKVRTEIGRNSFGD